MGTGRQISCTAPRHCGVAHAKRGLLRVRRGELCSHQARRQQVSVSAAGGLGPPEPSFFPLALGYGDVDGVRPGLCCSPPFCGGRQGARKCVRSERSQTMVPATSSASSVGCAMLRAGTRVRLGPGFSSRGITASSRRMELPLGSSCLLRAGRVHGDTSPVALAMRSCACGITGAPRTEAFVPARRRRVSEEDGRARRETTAPESHLHGPGSNSVSACLSVPGPRGLRACEHTEAVRPR